MDGPQSGRVHDLHTDATGARILASLKTGWRRLYRRELVRLLQGAAEAEEVPPDVRTVFWRVVSA
jgi:hypothetical protein